MTQVWGATTRGAPTWPLAVKSHQVVRRDDDPGDRGVATEAGVAPVPIVVMQPFGELEPPLARVTKPAGIGPLVECGLDEALGLAVRARSVRPREEVANPEPLTGLTKAPRSIARAVIRHDGPHAHPEAGQAAHRAVQKADGGAATLIRQDIGRGPARGIVDGHVREFPASAADRVTTVTTDAMAGAHDAAQLLDVEMHQRAALAAFIANDATVHLP